MYSNGFYNPYMYNNIMNTANVGRTMTGITKPTLGLSGLLKKFNLTSFLNGASKTLNIVNQAIPIYYQVKPMINNAKTMFKVMKAVKTPEQKTYAKPVNTYKEFNNAQNKQNYSNNGNPTFFL